MSRLTNSTRPYWRCYYSNTDAIIYVVDSADKKRMGIAKDELFAMLEEEELKNAILVVFANKQDLKDALSVEEVSNRITRLLIIIDNCTTWIERD